MAIKISKVDVWAAQLVDQPGDLARVLDSLSAAGASVECVIGRRTPERPGSGVVWISPIKGKKVQQAASAAGLKPATNLATLRVEGADKRGLGSRLCQAVADAGVNIRGVSAMVCGKNFVAYYGFDDAAAAAKAASAMKKVK